MNNENNSTANDTNTDAIVRDMFFDKIVVVENITPRQASSILRRVAERDVVWVSAPSEYAKTILGITQSDRRIGLAKRGDKYALLLGAEMDESERFWDDLNLSTLVDSYDFRNAARRLASEGNGGLAMPGATFHCNWWNDPDVTVMAEDKTDDWLELFDLSLWAKFAAEEAAKANASAKHACELLTGTYADVTSYLLPYTDLGPSELRMLAIREMLCRCVRIPYPQGNSLYEESGDNFLNVIEEEVKKPARKPAAKKPAAKKPAARRPVADEVVNG